MTPRKPFVRELIAGTVLLALICTAENFALAADTPSGTTPKTESTKDSDGSHMGLTIMGDRETPLGLFITPWKNAYPPQREDRPALLLDEAARPLDPDTFQRQSNYDEAFSMYRKSGTLP